MSGLRVGIDATPLVGRYTGVARYVHEVCWQIAALPEAPEQILTLFSRPHPLPSPLPRRTRPARRTAPARILHPLWKGIGRPRAEWLTGPVDVFHGGNYIVPPVRRAATAVTIHDLTFRHYPEILTPASRRLLADLPRRVLGYDAVFTVSQAVADEVVAELGVARERVVVAPNGVDRSWSLARPPSASQSARLGLPERYLLFVGTSEPRKNLATLLAGYRQARAADPDLPDLVLVGAKGWGEQSELPPGARMLGYVSDEDLRTTVAGAVAVCSPSLYEGFGLPVLEGLATGRPVLASDIAAHREVCGGQAELIPPRDVDAWSQALLQASWAPEEPSAESIAARRAAAEPYTWERSARIHLDTYVGLA